MAAVSLFWDTNMATMTSCENTQLDDVLNLPMPLFSINRSKSSSAYKAVYIYNSLPPEHAGKAFQVYIDDYEYNINIINC